MSRLKERKEKNCLNCNAEVQGKYCHVCGQENVEPKETIWHLVSHFFKDITHFEGNFFSTLKFLFTRPGFLSREYMIGRRASYINPVRMYIFTSAFFFLIFFNFFNTNNNGIIKNPMFNGKTIDEANKLDSAAFADYTRSINKEYKEKDVPMSKVEFKNYTDSFFKKSGFIVFGIKYRSRATYDSALVTGKEKDNWLERQINYKIIAVKEKYKDDPERAKTALMSGLMHGLPQLLFISLPLLALLLKWLYFRRKQFYYVNHAIFSIHLYIFTFIVLLILFTLDAINSNYLHWRYFILVNITFFFGLYFYTYKAMRGFYQQRRAKTIIKFLLLSLMFLILMTLLFAGFFLFSFFTI